MNVDEMLITLGLDTKGVQEGMATAENTINKGMSNIRNALAGVAGATAFVSMFKNVAQEADNLAKMSQTLQMNIEDLDAWGQAVARAGGSAESFQQSALALTSNISMIATKGTSRAKPFFDALGISVLDAGGKARDTIAVMQDISSAIEGMGKQESYGMLSRMGLDRGTITLLQNGRKGLDELIRKQKEFGVYTAKDAKLAEEFNDSIGNLTQSIKRGFMPIVAWLAPTLTKAFTRMGKSLQDFSKHTIILKGAVVLLGGAIVKALVPAFIALGKAMLTNPITYVILAIAGLLLMLDDLIVYMNGGKSAFPNFWKALLGDPEIAKKRILRFTNTIETAITSIGGFISQHGDFLHFMATLIIALGVVALAVLHPIIAILIALCAILTLVGVYWGDLKLAVQEFANSASNYISEMVNGIIEDFNSIVDTANSIIGGVLNAFSQIGDGIKNIIGGAIDTVKGWFSSLTTTASNVANTAKGALANANAQNTESDNAGGGGGDMSGMGLIGRNGLVNNNQRSNTVNVGTVNLTTSANNLAGSGGDFAKGLVGAVNSGVMG